MRIALPLFLFTTTLTCSLFAMPAYAARDRVFVASYGDDSNPCTFGSPCKTFQQAINTVADPGEVTAIDSAGFGPVSISNRSLTITSPAGIEAGIVTTALGTAITIDAGSSNVVVLRGLTLDGAASANVGIHAISGARLEIIDCTVRNFRLQGIFIQSPAAMSIAILHTIVSDIVLGSGILLSSNGGPMIATLDHVTATNNELGLGADASNGSPPIETTVSNSHVDNNNIGVLIAGSSVGPDAISNLILNNVTVNQSDRGIYLDGYASVWFSNVTAIAVAGILAHPGVTFGNTNNAAYSDGTSQLGTLGPGVTIGPWALQ